MVIAYANRTGNWRRVNLMGNSVDEGVKEILGMNAKLPNLSPVKILASITKVLHLSIINLVPLQRPSLGAIFRNNIIGQPTFKSS
ncbi:hypothetical protein LguiB_031951 [Lonicera macranthoides]